MLNRSGVSRTYNTKIMIKTVQLSDEVINDSIRRQMSVADKNQKGLMSAITEFTPYRRQITINPSSSVELDMGYGLIVITNRAIGTSAVFLSGASKVSLISSVLDIYSIEPTPNKVCVYKNGEYKVVIENNLNREFKFYVSVI